MRVGRTSAGSRIISALLVLCMVLGMIPATAMPVFAAESTTADSVARIRTYAENLLNSNFGKAASEDADSTSDKFTWDTEGKKTNWRYYNGVMLDALLMLGVDSDAGNALEFAKDFLDTNTEDASKAVTHYTTKEVDSVPPALVLFDLLDTAEVTESDRAIYVKAINYVYGQLEAQTKYSNCGGNLLHKMDNDSWSTWNIGLDGIYMAQPFYMEYAAALEGGKITNTVNSKSASDIYKEVYDRLMWVADTMYDSNTGLYHHGWDVSGNKGNGHFWSRGIGWYAAGLVMCIDLMPAGPYKTDLISKATKLFDGMLPYQDDTTGLWYNVVNQDNDLDKNELETSGSALMAYAMIKAYNEGWVDAKYATAGVKAFNGIVANKLNSSNTEISGIYLKSGVGTSDSYYCSEKYEKNEAKGVGGVIMAAAEVDRYLGNSEDFTVGVVVAPEMIIAAGATTVDTSAVKVSLLGSQGSIANGVASQMNYVVGAASNGKATVTVKNGEAIIGTFEVKVVDPTVPAEGEGTLGIESGEVTVPSNPSFSAGDFVLIHAASDGGDAGSTVYKLAVNGITSGKEYIIVAVPDADEPTAGVALKNKDTGSGGNASGESQAVTINTSEKTITISANEDLVKWTFTSDGDGKYLIKNNGRWLRGNQNSNILTNSSSDSTRSVPVNLINAATGEYQLVMNDGSSTRDLIYNGSSWTREGSANTTPKTLYLYEVTTSSGEATPAVYAQLTGTQGFVYPFGVASGDIITDIKASTDFKVLVSANSDGSGATEVVLSDSLVTVEKNSDYKNDEAKTNNFIVKYDGVQIGTIPVVVYDNNTPVTNYDVKLTVTPSALVLTKDEDYFVSLDIVTTVTDESGEVLGNFSGAYTAVPANNDIVSVTGNGVSVCGVGSTTITVTLNSVTNHTITQTYDVEGISVTIPVVVNAKPVVEEVTYSITGLTILPGSVEVGQGAQATATAAASDASGNHSYTFNYAITSGGSGASINSTTGAITTTAAGTYTVTATLGQVDGNGSFNAGTVTKTATFTVVEPASYDYTIKDADGNALAGQTITLSAGETYTPSFSVKLGDQDVTSGYSMTLTSESTAISINGTTITANKVNEDTVATVTATVTPFNRASGEGTSVDFNVTVKAFATSDDGNDDTVITVPSVSADTVYTKLTAINSNITYAVIGRNSSNRTATHGTDPGVQEASWTAADDGWKYGAVAHLWVIEKIENSSNYHIYYMDGTTKYYLNGDGSNNLVCATTPATEWALSFSGETVQITVASGTGGNADNRIYLNVDGSAGPKFESSAQSLVLYAPVNTTPAVTYSATLTLDAENVDLFVGNGWKLNPTVVITDSNGNQVNNAAYTIVWNSSSSNVTVTNGDLYAAGVASNVTITASISSINIGGNDYDVSASDTATVNSKLKTVTTGPVNANAGDLVTFSLRGTIPAGSWGWLDNVKIYRDNTLVKTIDFTNEADRNEWNKHLFAFDKDNGNDALRLWLSKDEDRTGSASYEFIADAPGAYTVVYEMWGNTTVTDDATITETLTAQPVSYTYELYAQDGTLLGTNGTVIYPIPIFTVEVGDTWTPYVVVTRNGVDVSSQYEIRFPDYLFSSFVKFNGSTVTAILANPEVYMERISVYEKSGSTELVGWIQPCKLNITQAVVHHWIDVSTGFANNTSGDPKWQDYETKETIQSWTFTSTTVGNANYHTPLVQVMVGDTAIVTIRSDSWAYEGTTNTVEFLPKRAPQDPADWNAWLAANKAGTEVTITTQLVGTNLIVGISNEGIESVYVIEGVEGTPTLRITGEQCYMDNPKWSEEDSSVTHIDISDIVAELGGTTGGVQYVLDTDGIDPDAEYIIVDYYGGKAYALGHSGTGEKVYAVTVNGNVVTIDEANVETALWTFTTRSSTVTNGGVTYQGYYITNGNTYLRYNNNTVFTTNKSEGELYAAAYDLATGQYRIALNASSSELRDLNLSSTSDWRRGDNGDVNPVYLFKKIDGGTVVATPVSATVSPSKINVANSGTVDLSGVTMEVTMSDGTKKTIQNADLTYDISGINTAVAKEHTVPVSYTEGGKTVTANVTVVVAAASSGTTTSELWKHNFTVDGETDTDEFYNISGKYSTSYTGSYGDLDFTKSLKMESSTKVRFTAPNEGTFTLVFDTKDSPGHSVYLTDANGTKKSYTVPSDGVLTIDLPMDGEYLLEKKDGASYLFYMEYASAVTDGIKVTAPGTLYIAGSAGWNSAAPTHTLQYTVRHNDQDITSGYTIEWSSLDSSVVRVDENGVITGLKSGTTSVTAKVTIDGEEYSDTVQVTVAGPGVSATEEMELIFGETGKDSGTITSTVYAGGRTTNDFTLGYFSSDENVATVDSNGVVTAKGKGEATIYTYVTHVNGYQIYFGENPSVDAIPNIYDTTKVTVTAKEVVDAHLNSYEYVARTAEFKSDFSNIHDALEALELNIYFNTGDSIEGIKWNDPNLEIDFSTVDPTSATIQTALVTYTDPVMGELFRDTIWIHLETFDPTQFDGIVTYEDGIHFVLDTDGINVNEEYAIVPGNANNVALRNPSATSTSSGAAANTSVTLAHGNVVTKLDDSGNVIFRDVDYLTMNEHDVEYTSWLLDTFVENVRCPDGVTRTQMNASSLLRYLGSGSSATQLIHPNAGHVYLETVSEVDGEYRIILGFGRNNQPYYLGYDDGVWTATTEESSVYMYRKHIEMTADYGVNYDVTPESMNIPEGFVADPIVPSVIYNEDTNVSADNYTIVWSSSDESVATVDQNGVVTGIKPGKATISATLYDVYGMVVVCTTHNVEYITKTVDVEVVSAKPVPELYPDDEMTIGVGTMPNFSKISVRMTFEDTNGEYDYDVPFDQINFKLADATGTADDGTAMDRFDNTVTGTYTVPVTYAGQEFTLTIHVVKDPYAGLEEADSIPGFPDAGSVRMNKTAKGVLDFTATGVTKIELNLAGVSTKNSVDVVLIVDVSNSMGWTTTWFEGMSSSEVEDATDSQKVPAGGAGTGTDKLALAMATADDFAETLLNVEGGDNTITFVTFAGADRDHGGSSDYVDSVRTPMVGISDYNIAAQVFKDTKFTTLNKDGTGATYMLQIGGYDDDGYGEAKVSSGSNRGNTNYDYAFGEAIDAVNQLKAKYNATHDDTYEQSGRQIHVVFMTDGAPSHYNGQRGNGSANDTLWSESANFNSGNYKTLDGNSESKWLEYIKSYNLLADELKGMIDSAYTVGFDMAHGGFGDYSYNLDEMQRVLEGLAKNTIVPVTMADDEEELNDYFTTLARALAYAGTNAQVTDVIGGNFSLFTGVSMYSSDIVDDEIMSQDTYNAMSAMSFPITVNSYRLVTASDIGKSMSVIKTDGSTETVTVADEHLGLRVNEDPEILEQITFSADGTEAYSNLKSGNIMTVNNKGERVIDAETFTYTATLDTVMHEGKETVHAKDETIKWKIGTITDREIAMEYYAYLDGSLDNPREAVEAVYATNEYAYAEYVDVYGKYVKRYYGVPQIAWGKANVTVRFFLVNEQGQYVNRAGVAFTNPANRIFLDGRAQYEAELNNSVGFTALDALAQAGLAGSNVLYDVKAGATVTNSNEGITNPVAWVMNNNLLNIKNLLTYTDTSGGYGSNVIIDIPVIMTDKGESERPMANTTVVMDYGKPMDINVFGSEEKLYAQGYPNVRPDDNTKEYWYEMEVMGFAAYSANHDLRDYVDQKNVFVTNESENTYFTTANGKYLVTTANGNTQIRFIPTTFLDEVEQVFVAVKFQEYNYDEANGTVGDKTDRYYIMYKQVNILPATVMYYETNGDMGGAFTYSSEGWTLETGNSKDPVQDEYVSGSDIYGADSSYAQDSGLSNNSSYKAEGKGVNDTTVSFTFTGTGFDIISRTGEQQGMIRVIVKNSRGEEVKRVTVTNKGTYEMFQIPVVSMELGAYDTYSVEIGVYNAVIYPAGFESLSRGNEFYFDAVRIYGAMADTVTFVEGATMVNNEYTVNSATVGSIYASDGEYKPEITEVGQLMVDLDTFISIKDDMASGLLFMDTYKDGETTVVSTNAVGTYKTYGANNEVYLSKGQGIAFVITSRGTNPASIQIGAKSITGGSVTLNAAVFDDLNNKTPLQETITTSTAMFYELPGNMRNLFADGSAYVVIWNTEDSVLSITDIKVAYDREPASAVTFMFSRSLANYATTMMLRSMVEDAGETGSLKKDSTGEWYYTVGSVADTSYTGLVEHTNGTWYVVNGEVDFSYNGLVEQDGETYYIRGGCVDTGLNGLRKLDGIWMYFDQGHNDTAFAGLVAHNGMLVYAENGQVNFNKTGTASYDGEVYYVKYGIVSTGFSGLVKSDEGKWIYMTNGKFDTSYNGFAKYNGNWWYVVNGEVALGYSGIASDGTNTFTVKYGQVIFADAE